MVLGGEPSAVQYPLINYSTQVGWKYLKSEEAIQLHACNDGLLLLDTLLAQLQPLHPDVTDRSLGADIAIPPLYEQQEISHIISVIDEKIRAKSNNRCIYNVLFNSLLHHLMTGKVRVRPTADNIG